MTALSIWATSPIERKVENEHPKSRTEIGRGVLGAAIAYLPNVASTLPMLDALTIKNAAPPAISLSGFQ